MLHHHFHLSLIYNTIKIFPWISSFCALQFLWGNFEEIPSTLACEKENDLCLPTCPNSSFLGSLSPWLCTHEMLTSLLFILLSHVWLGCKPLWESEESSGWQYLPSHKMPWTLVMKAHPCPNAGCLMGFLVLADTVDRVYSKPLIQKWVLIHNYIFLSVFSQISVGF